ncbi:hypothetical protein L9F63_012829, partial [Diploptera punctata]
YFNTMNLGSMVAISNNYCKITLYVFFELTYISCMVISKIRDNSQEPNSCCQWIIDENIGNHLLLSVVHTRKTLKETHKPSMYMIITLERTIKVFVEKTDNEWIAVRDARAARAPFARTLKPRPNLTNMVRARGAQVYTLTVVRNYLFVLSFWYFIVFISDSDKLLINKILSNFMCNMSWGSSAIKFFSSVRLFCVVVLNWFTTSAFLRVAISCNKVFGMKKMSCGISATFQEDNQINKSFSSFFFIEYGQVSPPLSHLEYWHIKSLSTDETFFPLPFVSIPPLFFCLITDSACCTKMSEMRTGRERCLTASILLLESVNCSANIVVSSSSSFTTSSGSCDGLKCPPNTGCNLHIYGNNGNSTKDKKCVTYNGMVVRQETITVGSGKRCIKNLTMIHGKVNEETSCRDLSEEEKKNEWKLIKSVINSANMQQKATEDMVAIQDKNIEKQMAVLNKQMEKNEKALEKAFTQNEKILDMRQLQLEKMNEERQKQAEARAELLKRHQEAQILHMEKAREKFERQAEARAQLVEHQQEAHALQMEKQREVLERQAEARAEQLERQQEAQMLHMEKAREMFERRAEMLENQR